MVTSTTGRSAANAALNPASKAAKLASMPFPPDRMTSSHCSRENGITRAAAMAPNKQALITLPLSRANLLKSARMNRLADCFAASMSPCDSMRPSPMAVRSGIE